LNELVLTLGRNKALQKTILHLSSVALGAGAAATASTRFLSSRATSWRSPAFQKAAELRIVFLHRQHIDRHRHGIDQTV